MLRKHAIKKIITSTLALGILLLLMIFPNKSENLIPEEVIYVDELVIPIYAIDHNNYVARTNLVKSDKDQIEYLINALTIESVASNYLPANFTAIIPKETKLINYSLNDGLLKLNFSKEFLNVKKENEEKLIESLIYSLLEVPGVSKIMIFIDGSILDKLPSGKRLPTTLDKSYGINKEYTFYDIKNTSTTTVYYIGKYNDSYYYIPITKVSNEKVEPVEIIINELKRTPIYENNLISYLNASYELKDYQILEDSITLSFNNKLLANLKDNDIFEKVKYTLSYSLRDTYNISNIEINVN